ncbi:unnamed protein product [Parnassius apollo]|uniref:(apollo) hypothetical protein n=1 Tax=Parnassius apollo TaxID=110799 RepID=A0A8S3YFR6_PARAO|nr:unnamed protein product [Parnassius apollo]
MSSTTKKCSGCKNNLPKREHMVCVTCNLGYDLFCANITPKCFYLMDQERKNNWRCQECSSKQPKSDNTNTPVRTTYRPMVSGDDTNVEEESNITVRTKKQRSKSDTNDSYIKEDSLRSIIKQEITDTIKQLVSEHLTNIASQVTGFHESLAFFSKQYDELMQTVKERNEVIQSLIQKNDNLSSQVRSLTERIEQIEQNMRAPNVEINGIPEHKSENLLKTIEQLGFAIENPPR